MILEIKHSSKQIDKDPLHFKWSLRYLKKENYDRSIWQQPWRHLQSKPLTASLSRLHEVANALYGCFMCE